MGVDWFSVIELLLRGPSGWLALGLGTVVTTAVGYYTARHRYKKVRVTTHAYLGGEKGFESCNESDIDDRFLCFERYDDQIKGLIAEFNRTKGGARADIAVHILKVADRMLEECDELLRLNIAFRTKEGHGQFLDQIDNRRRGAQVYRREALRVLEQPGQRAKAASG